jgi:hypothetical protein
MELPASNVAHSAPQLIGGFFDLKSHLLGELSEVCAGFIGGPRDGIDYGALVAKVPKIRAQLEAADKSQIEGSVLAFATLLSNRPDSQGHMSFLTISRDQRENLLQDIESKFGSQIASGERTYAVDVATIFRDKLKEYHASDER